MPTPQVICAECGALLSSDARICSHCGATIEPGARSTGESTTSSPQCPSCGHHNMNPGMYCEVCGARLAVQKPADDSKQPPGRVSKQGKKSGMRKHQKRPTEDLVAAFLGLALVVGLVYHEFSREMPSAAESVPASPEETSHGREIRALQASVDRNPQDYELLLSLANRLQDYAIQDRSLLPRAVEAYTRYLDANPASQNPRVDLGICYFELSKLEPARANEYVLMAIREMETVYNANPQHQPAAFNLGIVHLSAGHLDQATEWFRRAVTINENSELGQRAQRLLEQHAFEQSVN